jgi:hypothetical protein
VAASRIRMTAASPHRPTGVAVWTLGLHGGKVESKGAARPSPQFVGELAKTLFCSLALADKGNPSSGKEGRDESRPSILAGCQRNNFCRAGLLWSALDNWNSDGERGRAGVRFLMYGMGNPRGVDPICFFTNCRMVRT